MKALAIGAALLVLSGCAVVPEGAAPERVTESKPFAGNAPRGSGELRAAMLDGRRRARAEVGLPPLVWDEVLASHAQGYADTLAQTGRFEHAGQSIEGENLFTGTRGAYRYGEMVDLWVDEKKDYLNAAVPASSRTGKFAYVGHYNQIVWRATTRFCCALASNARDDVLVCRYASAGNVLGETAY